MNQRYNPASFMPKKTSKRVPPEDVSKDLWISPRMVRKSENSQGAWGNRDTGMRGSDRFLELADIALGTKKPEPRKKRPTSASTHVSGKSEPYSR
jgi:hypothetical protein